VASDDRLIRYVFIFHIEGSLNVQVHRHYSHHLLLTSHGYFAIVDVMAKLLSSPTETQRTNFLTAQLAPISEILHKSTQKTCIRRPDRSAPIHKLIHKMVVNCCSGSKNLDEIKIVTWMQLTLHPRT
jgi:hypothetical protein